MKTSYLYYAIPLMGLSALAEDTSFELRPLMELTPGQTQGLTDTKSLLMELSSKDNINLLYIKPHSLPSDPSKAYISTFDTERNVRTGALLFQYIWEKADHANKATQIKSELKYAYTDRDLKTEEKDIVGEKGTITLDGNALEFKIEKSEHDEDMMSIHFDEVNPIYVESLSLVQEDGSEPKEVSKSYSIQNGRLSVSYKFKKDVMPKVKKLRIAYYPGKYQEATLPVSVKLPLEQKNETQQPPATAQVRPLMELVSTHEIQPERSVLFELSANEKMKLLYIKSSPWRFFPKGTITTTDIERNANTGALLFSYVWYEGEESLIKETISFAYTDKDTLAEEKDIVGTEGTIALEGHKLEYKIAKSEYNEGQSMISIESNNPIAIKKLEFIDQEGNVVPNFVSSYSNAAGELDANWSVNNEDVAKIKKLRIQYYPGEYQEMSLPIEVKLPL